MHCRSLESKGAAWAFFQRQFWQALKLLKNVLMFEAVVGQQVLVELSFDAILNRYIMLAMQNSPLNDEALKRCRMVRDSHQM